MKLFLLCIFSLVLIEKKETLAKTLSILSEAAIDQNEVHVNQKRDADEEPAAEDEGAKEEDASILPIDDQASILPIDDETTILPIDDQASILPIDDQASILPIDDKATILPVDDQSEHDQPGDEAILLDKPEKGKEGDGKKKDNWLDNVIPKCTPDKGVCSTSMECCKSLICNLKNKCEKHLIVEPWMLFDKK